MAALVRVAAATVVAVALAACEATSPLDAAGLERQIHALASLSMEAAFVADEAAAGHLTSAYIRAHLDNLLSDAASARHELARPALPSLAARQRAAQALAAQLTQVLEDVAVTPPGAGSPVRRQQDLATRLKHRFDALRSTT